jgi:tellurite resistance protein TerC
MEVSSFAWVAVVAVILAMLAVDLFLHREAREISAREAAIWTGVWVGLGLTFAVVVAIVWGAEAAGEYLAGYLIEKSLAVDNVFVFAVIFTAFAIPVRHQHRVLFWGVLGALILRAGFIAAGAALLARFHWTMFVFGGILLFTAWRMWRSRHRGHDPEQVEMVAISRLRRFLPLSERLDGQRFFTIENGRRMATPLFGALVAVELADVVFAVDSIPAIFAVTSEPFLVFTSNAFAILGLRSMYFFLADMIRRFEYLTTGLALVLAFVGLKMLAVDLVKVPVWVSLAMIVTILGTSIVVSLRKTAARSPEVANSR